MNNSKNNRAYQWYRTLYHDYRYRFEINYKQPSSLIRMRLPKYLTIGKAINVTQIFWFKLRQNQKNLEKRLGQPRFKFLLLKIQQQMTKLQTIQSNHQIYGINPDNGLVHPLTYLETRQMASCFLAIIKKFPFDLNQFRYFQRLFVKQFVYSIKQGLQIVEPGAGTTFLIKVNQFIVLYHEVPDTSNLNLKSLQIQNRNVKINSGSHGINVDLQTDLFTDPKLVLFNYAELISTGKRLQRLAKQVKLGH